MRKLTRKQFLGLSATAVATTAVAPMLAGSTPGAFAQTTNFTTIAQDPDWPYRGKPLLIGATGSSLALRTLETFAIAQLRTLNMPHSGPYVTAWMLGGQVSSAVYRNATIELQLAKLSGYHFVELFLGDIYPFQFWDATAVRVAGHLANGYPVEKALPRFQTLDLPSATIRILATYGGQQLSAFELDMPHVRSRQVA